MNRKKMNERTNKRANIQRMCERVWRMNNRKKTERQQFIIIAFIFRFSTVCIVVAGAAFFLSFFFHVYPPFSRRCSAYHPHSPTVSHWFFYMLSSHLLSRAHIHTDHTICCDNKTYSDLYFQCEKANMKSTIHDCCATIRRTNMRSSVAVLACATIWII